MLKAFFDASRTKVQTGVFVIGGYVGSESFWTDFEASWKANLDYWQIADFDLTECFAGTGEFRRAGFDRHKRELCALNFGRVIVDKRPDALWSGLVDEDWGSLPASASFRSRYPSPYQFLFEDIIWQLARWGRGFARGELIAPVFDIDADPRSVEPIYAGLKASHLYDNLVASVTFGSRKKFVPLQAADVIAGEMQRHWFEREYPNDPTLVFPMWRNLLVYATPMGNTGGLWGAETLARAAEAFDRTGDPFNWSVSAPSDDQLS